MVTRRDLLLASLATVGVAVSATTVFKKIANRGWDGIIDHGSSGDLDLRNTAKEIARHIIAQHDASKTTRQGKAFFAFMGEYHNCPAHILLQIMTLQNIQDLRPDLKLSVGLERPINIKPITHRYVENMGNLNCNTDNRLSDLEADTIIGAQPIYSPISHDIFNAYLSKKGLTTSFNDVGLTMNEKINLTNSVTQKYLRALSKTKVNVDPVSPEGVAFRNYVIFNQAQDHADATGADIYLQTNGTFHLFGSLGYKYAPNDSLATLCQAAKIHSCFYVPMMRSFSPVAEIVSLAGGMQGKRYYSAVGLGNLPNDSALNRDFSERKFVKNIAQASHFTFPDSDGFSARSHAKMLASCRPNFAP